MILCQVLSLARNNIKNLSGLEAVGDGLEELWISYNIIDRTKGVSALRNLKVSNNHLTSFITHFALTNT